MILKQADKLRLFLFFKGSDYMRIFDAHCDTISKLLETNECLLKNSFQLDIERMELFGTYIQIFAAFIDKKSIKATPLNRCLSLIEKYKAELKKGRIEPILTKEDLMRADKNGGAYSILAIEGGEALGGDTNTLSMYYDAGVRLITLTWNWANEIAEGVCEDRGGGLTDFGRQVVSAMENMGIMIDVSHLSKKGFWDVIDCTEKPFIASHSCVEALCSHIRNLDDEQIKAIIEREGVIGVNFYPEFLSDTGRARAERIYEHIEYILGMNGENSVGFGSDFDGVDLLPDDMSGAEDIQKLISVMAGKGLPSELIEKIAFGNFSRIFYEILK